MSGMGEIVAAAWVDTTKRPTKAVVKCMWFLCCDIIFCLVDVQFL
jgi:hypothetical protein